MVVWLSGWAQAAQCLDSCLGIVYAILAARKDLCADFLYASVFEDCSNRASRENTLAWSAHDVHSGARELGVSLVRNRAVLVCLYLDHVLLGITDGLFDSNRSISCLALAHAYAAFLVTDDYGDREAEAASSSNHAGHAADLDDLLVELRLYPSFSTRSRLAGIPAEIPVSAVSRRSLSFWSGSYFFCFFDFWFHICLLKIESSFAGAVSQCGYATDILEAASIEHDAGYLLCCSFLGDILADQSGLLKKRLACYCARVR